ncbi:MAG: SpoIIE family protein phosphatase [Leptospira sp.]|nr:SpoIIE family protein phosphatase [Leptospira sp.]
MPLKRLTKLPKRTLKTFKFKRQDGLGSPVFSLSALTFTILIFFSVSLSATQPLTKNIETWEDKTNKLKIDDILNHSESIDFKNQNVDFFNFGFTGSSHWFRFLIDKSHQTSANPLLLQLVAHNIDSVTFYFVLPNGQIVEKRTGHMIPMSLREIKHRNYVVEIPKDNFGYPIYLKVKSDISLQFAVNLIPESEIREKDYTEQWVYGLFFGSLGLILIYNLAISFFVRDINYVYYLGYVFFFGLGQMSLLGFSQFFLFPELTFFMRSGISLFFSTSLLFFGLFTNSFLKLNKRLPIASRLMHVMIGAFIINIVFSLSGQIYLASIILSWLTTIFALFVLSLIILGFYKRIRSFYYFGAAFIILMTSSIVYSLLKVFTIETNSFLEEMLFPIASLADITLFSFALADRIQLLRLDKDRAEAQVMRHEKERQISRDILMQSLPKTIPNIDNLQIQVFIQPMKQVGGDFYEFYSPNTSELGTLLCDVSGHGIPASLISAMGKIAYATQKDNLFSPKRVLEGMNQVLFGNCTPQYLTAAYTYINVETKTWRFGRAGHPSSYLQRKSGEIIKVHPKGRIIGAFPHISIDEVSFPTEPGDRVLILTDGVTETFNPKEEMYGENRLVQFLELNFSLEPKLWVKALITELESFSRRTLKEWEDDITFILLEIK